VTYRTVTIELNRRASAIEAHASIVRRALTGSFTTEASLDAALRAARHLAAEAQALAAHLQAQALAAQPETTP
jgi:hypothetical protein